MQNNECHRVRKWQEVTVCLKLYHTAMSIGEKKLTGSGSEKHSHKANFANKAAGAFRLIISCLQQHKRRAKFYMLKLHADHLAPICMHDTSGGFCSAFPFAALAKVPPTKRIRICWTKIFHIINLEDNKQALAALVSLEHGSQPHET